MQEFWDHEQLVARDRWRDVGSPGGIVRAMKPPFNLDSFEPRMDEIPALGAHTQPILAELGFAASEIERFREQRVIG
jgi:formyl-CoA transferase